jgi:hypothetical protein
MKKALRHWEIFTRLCAEADVYGNLVPGAGFAALAIESGCEWITLDLLKLENPKPAKIVLRLQGRLAEIFRLYPSSFKDKLGGLLEDKCSKLDRSSPE